jgi:hypothetical protein
MRHKPPRLQLQSLVRRGDAVDLEDRRVFPRPAADQLFEFDRVVRRLPGSRLQQIRVPDSGLGATPSGGRPVSGPEQHGD